MDQLERIAASAWIRGQRNEFPAYAGMIPAALEHKIHKLRTAERELL